MADKAHDASSSVAAAEHSGSAVAAAEHGDSAPAGPAWAGPIFEELGTILHGQKQVKGPAATTIPAPVVDGGASLIVPGNTNATNSAICLPSSVAGMDGGQDVVDYDQTKSLVQTLIRAALRIQDNEELRTLVLNVWQSLPDGAGRWCFTQPGADGPHLFYTFMTHSNLALAFECSRWKQCAVVLDVWIVLCWCPAGYVWPYCMFCHKFCFPYSGDCCHRGTKKHLRNVKHWRCGKDLVQRSLERQPRFKFFVL